jgi:hypothetical protein
MAFRYTDTKVSEELAASIFRVQMLFCLKIEEYASLKCW